MGQDYIVIVGCGRLGSTLANRLSAQGKSLVVIDREATAFESLAVEFSGFQVLGDASQIAVLRRAGLDQADSCLATTRHDNINLMVAQVARVIFGVPRVIARVYDPSREIIYRQFGIDTVCPTQLTADALLRALAAQPKEG